jgi:hypothetical protein
VVLLLSPTEAQAATILAQVRVKAQRADRAPAESPHLHDPVGWITERLGEHVWSKQRDIALAVRDHRRVAVHSCFESGKSWLAARLVAWWLDAHPPGEAFVVTTATTGAQVRAILWREIRRAHVKGKLAGHVNQTEWWLNGEMVAFGRKPADYDAEAFQGIHARYVLVVIDEAAGVPEPIWRAAAGLTANEHSRLLAIGNPNDPQSYFATICGPDSGWHVIGVSAHDTPNFSGEEIPDGLHDLLISRTYADELAAEVGEDSPVYVAKVLGRFPEDAADGVVPLSFIRACQRLDREYTDADLLPVELGVDVGAGGDETVIRERRGMVAGRTWRYHTPDSTQAAGYVRQVIDETGATRVKVDVIGIGWGVVGTLKEQHANQEHAAEIVGVNVGKASTDPKRFPKLRDQLWWEIGRELSRSHAWDLAAVDETTVAQLIAPTWKPDSAGRHKIEPKVETRKRLKRSPDDADALLLAYYQGPPSTGAGLVLGRAKGL